MSSIEEVLNNTQINKSYLNNPRFLPSSETLGTISTMLTVFTRIESFLTKANSILAPFDKLVTILIKLNSLLSKVNHVLAFAEVYNALMVSANQAFTVFQNTVSDVERNRNVTIFGSSTNVIKNNNLLSPNNNTSLLDKTVNNIINQGSSSSILNLTDEEIDAILQKYADE